MNRKEAHEKWGNKYRDNCDNMRKWMGIKLKRKLDFTHCGLVKAIEIGVEKVTKILQLKKENVYLLIP